MDISKKEDKKQGHTGPHYEEDRFILSEPLTESPHEEKTGKVATLEGYLQRCISLFPCYSRSTVCRPTSRDGLDSSTQSVGVSQPLPQQGLLPPLQCNREAHLTSDSASPRCRETRCQLMRIIGGGVNGVVFLATEVECNFPAQTLREKSEGIYTNSSCSPTLPGLSPLHPRPRYFVVKLIDLEGDNETRRNRTVREVQCLFSCNFSFIMRCYRDLVRRQNPNGPADNETNRIIAIALELEFANNGDLRAEIRTRAKQNIPFSERDALLIFLQILMAVHYLHNRNIIHRDIKSANVLLCSNGIVKLGDFGLSKMIDSGVDTPSRGSFVGTPYYIAPEIWQRKPYSKKVDMFSLGVLLYELLTLRRPFHGNDIDEVIRSTIDTEVDMSDIQSSDLANLVRSLLSKDPALRPSAEEVLALPLMRGIFAVFFQRAHKGEERDTCASGKALMSNDLRESESARSGQGSCCNKYVCRDESHRLLEDLCQVQRDVFRAVINARVPSDSILLFDDKSLNTSRVLIEGVIKKENNHGVWKSRHMSLNWVHALQNSKNNTSTIEGEIEIVFALCKDSPQRVCKSVGSFLDCFPVPERFAPEGASFVFTLLSKLGNTITFQADSEEEQKKWISAFLDCIEYVKRTELCDRDVENNLVASLFLKQQSISMSSLANCLTPAECEQLKSRMESDACYWNN